MSHFGFLVEALMPNLVKFIAREERGRVALNRGESERGMLAEGLGASTGAAPGLQRIPAPTMLHWHKPHRGTPGRHHGPLPREPSPLPLLVNALQRQTVRGHRVAKVHAI